MVPTADESARRNARRPASPIAPAVSLPRVEPAVRAGPRRRATGMLPSCAAVPHFRRRLPPAEYDAGTALPAPGALGRRRPGGSGAWFRVRSMRYGKEILLGAGLCWSPGS